MCSTAHRLQLPIGRMCNKEYRLELLTGKRLHDHLFVQFVKTFPTFSNPKRTSPCPQTPAICISSEPLQYSQTIYLGAYIIFSYVSPILSKQSLYFRFPNQTTMETANKMQQRFRLLIFLNQPNMFRATNSPIHRSTF